MKNSLFAVSFPEVMHHSLKLFLLISTFVSSTFGGGVFKKAVAYHGILNYCALFNFTNFIV